MIWSDDIKRDHNQSRNSFRNWKSFSEISKDNFSPGQARVSHQLPEMHAIYSQQKKMAEEKKCIDQDMACRDQE